MAAKSVPIAGLSDGVLVASSVNNTPAPQRLMGWSVHEAEAVAAVASFLLREGGASGKIVAAVELAANGSSTEWFGPNGVLVNGDLFFDIVAGTVEGSVYVA